MTIEPGSVLGDRYELGRQLGAGGMARVYLAYDRVLDREVAIKVLAERYAADPAFVERFRREASAAAGLNHPNIVAVYDRGEAEGTYYIVMEYLPGPDLKKVIRDQGPLLPHIAVDYALQILSALAAAHRRGIVHRDIKPQNVMVGDEGRLRVADFGIARAGTDTQMTEAGSVIGTAQYLSPEQARGEEVTAASDLYSLGVVLYEMLTARVPFDGDRPVAVAMKQINEPPVPPQVFEPDIPDDLNAVVLKALEKRPGARYQTAEEFGQALLEVRQNMPGADQSTMLISSGQPTAETRIVGAAPTAVVPPPDPGPSRRRRPVVIAAIVLVLLAAAVGAALMLTRGGGGSDTVSIPNVAGMDFQSARQELEGLGLKVSQRQRADDQVQAGLVIGTLPPSGDEVAKGSAVVLVVSSGPASLPVPNTVGDTLDVAQAKLTRAGFDVNNVNVVRRFDDQSPDGTVIDQDPAGGSTAAAADTITLTVSRGAQPVTVPDVLDQSTDSATAEIESAGLVVSITEQQSDSTDPGLVLDQDPAPGRKVPKGSTVTITVSSGPEQVDVPDVIGQDGDSARSKLEALGFNVVSSGQESSEPEGTVLDQSPGPGESVEPGGTVTIIIAFPPETTTSEPVTTEAPTTTDVPQPEPTTQATPPPSPPPAPTDTGPQPPQP